MLREDFGSRLCANGAKNSYTYDSWKTRHHHQFRVHAPHRRNGQQLIGRGDGFLGNFRVNIVLGTSVALAVASADLSVDISICRI